MRKKHKLKCVPFNVEPKHQVLGLEPAESNYYLANPSQPLSADRDNIKKIVKFADSPACQVLQILNQQNAEHNYRIGYVGASRYTKIVILLAWEKDCTSLYELDPKALRQVHGIEECGRGQLHGRNSP